ncbi:MAG: nuclear transport factor 2 family protein [Myxococcota bacterium]
MADRLGLERTKETLHRTGLCAVALLTLFLLAGVTGARSEDTALRPSKGQVLLTPGKGSASDRIAILELLSLYAHLYDDYETETWGLLFADDATFEIAYVGGGPENRLIWRGRSEIVESLKSRREKFRDQGIGRHHYLSNPLVYELSGDSARVASHLLLAAVAPDGQIEFETSGRYDGRVIKTPGGWRIQSWRFTPDGQPVSFANGL